MAEDNGSYEGWSVIELMGHRRLGGFVREVQIAGAGFFRVDVPGDTDGEVHSTQFYPPSSVYCLTPVSEEAAKVVARSSRPQPVQYWELPAPPSGGVCTNCGTALRVSEDGPLCNRCMRAEDDYDRDG